MPAIVVALQDIITDDTNPIDLTALPPEEAAARIQEIYGFLSSSVDVQIADGVATITLDDAKAKQASQALRTLERASHQAARGKYNRAIPLFQDVLRTLPDHTEARRELAMALMETGSAAAAKKHLIRVLQLDPNDAWAYLLLGNLYFQHEEDLGSADRYFVSALDLAPDDPYILNSAAAVKAKRGDYDAADAMFQQAIAAAPDYPNPRYGLALCYANQDEIDEALSVLLQLFAQPESDDPRHTSVYAEARRFYLDLIRRRAVAEHDENLAALQSILDDYTKRTGIGVRLVQDEHLSTTAKVELAWRYGRDEHVIKYKELPQAFFVYLITHEFEHVLLEEEARAAGRSKAYGSTRAIKQQVEASLEKDLRRIRKRARLAPQALSDYVQQIIDGQINQLYNMPLDLVIDGRIRAKYPFAYDGQLVFLSREQEQNFAALQDPDIQKLTPSRILQANLALGGAQALQADEFSGGAFAYADAYRPSGMLSTSEKIYALYQDLAENWQSGGENDLVDAVAQELKLGDWYDWFDDKERPQETEPDIPAEGGPTNPELLADPNAQTAVAMYMLGALKRFDKMSTQEITQVAGEIALLGQTGLDYSSSEKKYSLRFLPGEQFTGLQLMAYMYVGFKQTQPELDTGMPFDDAYEQALSMYNMGM